jgi:hypothetical protein
MENDKQNDQNSEQKRLVSNPMIEKALKSNEVDNIEAVKDPPNNEVLENPKETYKKK